MTRVYYRSTNVVITDEVFAIRGPVDMRFRLDRLHGAHIVSEDPPVRFVSAGGIIAIPVLAIFAGTQLHSFWAWTVAITVALVASTVIAVHRSRSGRASELRATYGELDVTLFRSTDTAVFGQVRRALSRALENRDTVSR
jgi:hypothetical protein